MKKKSCLTLALILVIVQVVSLFAVLPVSATTETSKSINITKTTQKITVDGIANENAWKFANSSEELVNLTANDVDDFTGSFKALWSPVEGDDTKMNLYIFIVVSGKGMVATNYRNTLRVWVGTSDGAKSFWTGMKKLDVDNKNIVSTNGTSRLWGGISPDPGLNGYFFVDAVNDIANSGTVTYEFCYQMEKAETIKLDVCVGACTSSYTEALYSWAGTPANTTAGAAGVATIDDSEPTGVELTMTDGASVRIDTTEAKTSGIRFASTVNLDQYNALLAQGATITTGTLIVPTNSLTVKEIADADFTKETLLAKGLIENTHFYDIVNTGNEWVKGEDGTWYATLYDIQDYERLFSAVGYVTVELNGVSTTYYAEYYSVDARSIAQVAETLMSGETEGDEGKWTAAQEAVLKSFFTQEAQS